MVKDRFRGSVEKARTEGRQEHDGLHKSRGSWLQALAVIGVIASMWAPVSSRGMQGAGGGESKPFAVASADASASFFSGAAIVSVPILIPPGRPGTTPELALEYSSQGGMGPAGFGWALPIGVLARSTKYGVPRCDGPHLDEYRVTLSASSNEVVESSPDLYLFEVDEAYTEATPDRNANRWTLRTREGLVYTFGDGSGEARVFSGADVFHDPGACAFTTAWYLTRVEDPNGNRIDVSYEKHGEMPIPVEIAYGANAAAGIEHPYRVRIETQDLVPLGRPLVRRFMSGVDQRLERRIRKIVVEGREAADDGFSEIRSYELGFDDSKPTQEFLLASVSATDLPTRRFDYSTSTPTVVASLSQPLDDPDSLAINRSNGPTMQLMDLNGDALLDRLCVHGGAWHAAYGDPSEVQFVGYEPCTNSGGNWSVPSGVGTSLNRITRQDHGVDTFITIEIDGDGVPDLVRRDEYSGSIRVYRGSCESAHQCGFSAQYEVWNNPGSSWNSPLRKVTSGNRGQQTKSELIDMNGDGRLDLVRADGSSWDWQVYPNTGSGFAPSPVIYAGVGPLIAYTSFPKKNAEQERQILDVNGDGLADWVNAPYHYDQTEPSRRIPRVYYAIDPTGEAWGPYDLDGGPYLCRTANDFDQAVLCANPTGLPAGWAIVGAMSVRLNTGSGFSETIYSPAPIWAGGEESANRLRGTWTATGSRETYTFRDFADVNGDGRVDWVHTGYAYDGSEEWYVLYNLGDGRFGGSLTVLSPATTLPAPSGGVFLGSVRPTASLAGMGEYMGRSFSHTNPGDRSDLQITVLDVDADGLAERARSVGIGQANQWSLRTLRFEDEATPHTRPMLLTRVHDGVGGTTHFRYAPSSDFVTESGGAPGLPFVTWVVTGIRRSDGLCDDEASDWFDIASSPVGNPCLAAGHEIVQKIEYADGLFDSPTREFRGFGTAWVQDGPDRTGSVRRIDFHQGEFLAGKIASEEVYVGGEDLLLRTTYEWRENQDGPRTQIFVLEQRVEEFPLYEQFGSHAAQCTVHRSLIERPDGTADARTRVHTSCSMACAGAGDADLDGCVLDPVGKKAVETSYAEPHASSQVPVWNRPARVVTRYVDDSGELKLSSEIRFHYDGLEEGRVERGNMTLELGRISESSAIWSEKRLEYDAGAATGPGNVTSLDLPSAVPREPTRFEFDQEFQLFAVVELAAPTTGRDGLVVQQRIERSYDFRNGRSQRRIGIHGASAGDVSGVVHDALGRPICEYEPGTRCTPFSLRPTRAYVHREGDPGAANALDRMSSLAVYRLEPNSPTGYLSTRSYWDALGRERLTTNEQVVGVEGATAPGTLETVVVRHLEYGSNGRVRRRLAPYLATGSLSIEPPQGFAAETYRYELNGNAAGFLDPAGRVFETLRPDGATPRTYYFGSVVRSVDALESSSSTGHHVVETSDAHGRAIERRVYEGAGPELLMQIEWRYDGADRVVETRQAGDPATAATRRYDLLGRLVETVDPDSGRWTTRHDRAGNVLFVDDPESGQSVQTCYDELDRVVLRCGRASDVYDPGLCSSTAPVCDHAYRHFYDESDNVSGVANLGLGMLTSVEGPDSKHRFVYDVRRRMTTRVDEILGVVATTSFEIDPEIDRLDAITYPDGERVRYAYDQSGAPVSLHLVDASGGPQIAVVSEMVYDLRGRPLYVWRGNGTVDWYRYHGAEQGFRMASLRSERIATTPLGAPEAFVDLAYSDYDGLSRIVEVVDRQWGEGPLTMSAGYEYDGAGRLTRVSGPNPEDFGYDGLGNMTESNGRVFEFDAERAGGSSPHQAVALTSPTGEAWAMSYDANGQRLTRVHASSGGTQIQSYAYDAFGSLRTLRVDGDEMSVGYDHRGERVFETARGETRRFFGGHSESKGGRLFKTYSIGAQAIATRSVPAPALSDSAASVAAPLSLPPEAYGLVMTGAMLLLVVPIGRTRRVLGLRIAASGGLGATLLVAAGVLPLAFATAGCTNELVVRHYHLDRLGSPIAITGLGGRVQRFHRYAAYGEVRRYSGAGKPLSIDEASRREFAGYSSDETSGLQYAGARFYDPVLARFLSLDPVEADADPYAYAGWDPVNRFDPDGRSPLVAAVLIALAFLAVVAGAVVNAVKTGSVGVFFRDFAVGWVSMNVGLLIGFVAPPSVSVLLGAAGIGQSLYTLSRSGSVDALVLAGVGLGLAVVGSAYGAYQRGRASPSESGDVGIGPGDGRTETRPIKAGVEIAGVNDGDIAALPGRALVKLNNDQINSRIADELAALRARAAGGEFAGQDVAAWEIRTSRFNRDLGVNRILSGSVHVEARPVGTPGFPDAFAPTASLAPIGTRTTISPPIWIAGTSAFGSSFFWHPVLVPSMIRPDAPGSAGP